MDKGAHFYNCDFQVHTPRDLSWTGKKYGASPEEVTLLSNERKNEIDDQRIQFAKEYLQKVRESGLNAIAITDHHDVTFAKIIREVAHNENAEFIRTFQENKCITVFPGMELTLSSPACQCLIIFDADFPNNDLDSVVNFLGLNPNNEYEESHSQITRISDTIIHNLEELHKKLDELRYCTGRYIVLPNVNKSGEFTLLRRGFNENYRKMPCVGGYVDKDISDESGYLNKLNGGDVNYGNKSIGVMSTSDNRFEDGRLFGRYSTWVKWEKPTAEALRQACLARESRLSQTKPEIPQNYISRLEVTGSKFMGSFTVEFSNQYNALIGGRGTGKSTILEYLRWGLCDQTDSDLENEQKSEIERRRYNLIDKTLKPAEGEVRISFSLNGIPHVIKRNSINKEILLKIDNRDFEKVKEEDIKRILPIHAYSQKQLSVVGVKTDELQRFIQQPIVDQLNSISFQLTENSKKSRSAYSNYLRMKELVASNDQINLQVQSLTDQVNKLRFELIGTSDEDQKIISQKQYYEYEEVIVKKAISEYDVISEKLNGLLNSINKYPDLKDDTKEVVNTELISLINKEREDGINSLKEKIRLIKEIFEAETKKSIIEIIDKWAYESCKFKEKYNEAKVKASSSQSQFLEIQRLENKLRDLMSDIMNNNILLNDIGQPDNDFKVLLIERVSLYQKKLDLLSEQSQILKALSNNSIKADYENSLDVDNIKSKISLAVQGARIREDKMDKICEYIKKKDNSLTAWNDILYELKHLAELKISDDSPFELPTTPILTECDFSFSQREKIAALLSPEKWLDIALSDLEFKPIFLYTTNNLMEDEIPFSEASAGQQATALLTVLLNQEGNPLVIDQPEDDIDNRAIREIVENIWAAKKKRQIIFTSHNANIVVNGDAELVVCCDYLESGNQTRGHIKAQGAIDTKVIKDEITLIMEGGEKAFKLRKEKYGF